MWQMQEPLPAADRHTVGTTSHRRLHREPPQRQIRLRPLPIKSKSSLSRWLVLRPLSYARTSIPLLNKLVMSQRAVACDDLVILVHLEVVSLPSKPSQRRLTTFNWRSFIDTPLLRCQNQGLLTIRLTMVSERNIALRRVWGIHHALGVLGGVDA